MRCCFLFSFLHLSLALHVTGLDSTQNIANDQDCGTLPDFSSGGLVFFLHIPKTGGTTIRRNIEQFDHIHYVFAKNYSTYWETAPLVEDMIGTENGKSYKSNNKNEIQNNNTILFYEIHATTAPSFYKLRKRLRRWRETASRNNVTIFFFTILRSSLPYAISHFNFFHVDQRNPTFEQCDATEESFIRMSLENPQCQFLYMGENSMRGQKAKNITITQDECHLVQKELFDSMDWVGTTEGLSNETLPLLRNLLKLPKDFAFERYRVTTTVTKKDKQYFGVDNLTSFAIQSINSMSSLDIDLYESAKRQYPYSMWKNRDGTNLV